MDYVLGMAFAQNNMKKVPMSRLLFILCCTVAAFVSLLTYNALG